MLPFAYIDPGTGFTILSSASAIIAAALGALGFLAIFFKRILRSLKKSRFLREHWKKILVAFLILVVLGGGAIGTGIMMSNSKGAFEHKIIVLGFDGLSPAIIDSLLAAGRLPNFQKLKDEGSYRLLATTNPSQSPVAWSGFATGQNPGKHGVFDFIVRDPADYSLRLSLSSFKRGKPQRVLQGKTFWQYASDLKVASTVIRCPVTFPPDRINGRMLAGMGVPDILGTEGTFSYYSSEPPRSGQDIGGQVFTVRRNPKIVTKLYGPRHEVRGKTEKLAVPLLITLNEAGVELEFQKKKLTLTVGQWSEWQEVRFDAGPLQKIRGIFKFHLVETSPELKLYVSPINFDPRDPYFPISYPADYAEELASETGLFHTQGLPVDTWAVNEGRLDEEALVAQLEMVAKEEETALDFELARFNRGLLFCYFGSSDIVQHMFWRYLDPQHPLYAEDAPVRYREMIHSWYERLDRTLGVVRGTLGEGDYLFVLSDHGFQSFRRAVHVNRWLRENGYLQLVDPYAEQGAELLKDVDWTKTRAFSIGFGAVYLNQRGREAEGIVEPGAESDRLKAEIREKLQKWTDPKDGQPVIHRVYLREEIFSGQAALQTPDLYIGFNGGYRASWQTALGAVPASLIEDNLKKWSGDHLIDPHLVPGVLFSNRRLEQQGTVSIYDLAPTILHILGMDETELQELNLDGRPLL